VGPKVTELTAILAKQLQAQVDEPHPKKRQREESRDEVRPEHGSLYRGNSSMEKRKKGDEVETQSDSCTKGSAVAVDQPRQSLWVS
jgi:hypothetical protein